MFIFSLVLLLIGGTLVYAGLSGGDNWKAPWTPFVNLLKG